jgi:hypothetical protein
MLYKILESRQIFIKQHHIIDSSGTRGAWQDRGGANTFVPVVYVHCYETTGKGKPGKPDWQRSVTDKCAIELKCIARPPEIHQQTRRLNIQ